MIPLPPCGRGPGRTLPGAGVDDIDVPAQAPGPAKRHLRPVKPDCTGNLCSRKHMVVHGVAIKEGAGLKIKHRAKVNWQKLISLRCHSHGRGQPVSLRELLMLRALSTSSEIAPADCLVRPESPSRRVAQPSCRLGVASRGSTTRRDSASPGLVRHSGIRVCHICKGSSVLCLAATQSVYMDAAAGEKTSNKYLQVRP